MPTARGRLEVTIEAEPPFFEQDGVKLNRNLVRKEFSGDMVGQSEAQMIAAYTATRARPDTSPSSTSPARSAASRARASCSTTA